MKNSKFYPAIVLGSICLVVAVLLSGINYFTAPIIADRENQKAFDSLKVVLPDGSDFKPMSLDGMPEAVLEAYSADGGFVFRTIANGKKGTITVMIGVDAEGKIVGTQVISESESAGWKEKVYEKVDGINTEYKGQNYESFEPILVAGSTGTSEGFAAAVLAALQAFEIANGAAVDTRTPEEILQANLNDALGTTDVVYERWFATEILEGIDKVYVPKQGEGFVFVIGEAFVGVNASGVTTADVSAENAAKASAAYALAAGSDPIEITELPAGIDRELVQKVSVTASGNYVFDLIGYGFYSEYGTDIEFSISISADGKIIDMKTHKQHKDEGQGSSGTDAYYDKWVGATNEDVVISTSPMDPTDVGAIAGSTYTSMGYQEAVKAAFAAFELITAEEGGNE